MTSVISAPSVPKRRVKDAVPLGVDIMHSVVNPIDQLTGTINNLSPFCETSSVVWLARR
jgi:hypothetical protein